MARCEKEQRDFSVVPAEKEGRRVLKTEKALKHGQIIGAASCLIFSTKALARDFLNQGGNAALMDAPIIEVQNIEASSLDGEHTGPRSLFCVQTGISQLIGHYKHCGAKVPNVEFFCTPSKGPNDGFLSIRVSTHNYCGVATQTVLTADFGDAYHPSPHTGSKAVRNFRGVMDLFLRRKDTAESTAQVGALSQMYLFREC